MYNDFYQEEELMGSLSSFQEALELNENKYFEVHEFEYIIDYYLSSQDIESSRKAIQKALLIHPKSHEIQKRLAQLYNLEGMHENAISILEKSFASFGTDKDLDYYLIVGESYLGIGNYKKAKQSLEKAISISEEEYFEIVTTVAALYQQEGYYEEVIKWLKSIHKEDSSLLFDIGLSYHSLMDYPHSIEYLGKFVKHAPFSVDGWFYLAKSYSDNKQFEQAEEAFLNTVALAPDIIIYQYELAKVYIDQSKYIQALDVYKEILSKDKNVNHSIFLSIGDICYNLEQYGNAKKNYEIALRLNPESAEAYHSLAQIEIESDSFILAKSFVQKAIAIDSNKAHFFITMGTINQLLGELESAEYSYLEAIRIAPSMDTAWHLLIDYYYFSDRPAKSISTALDAIKSIEDDYVLDSKISAAYFDLKEIEKAQFYLKRALAKNKETVLFFLDYYPEGKDNSIVMSVISLFKKNIKI